ncbi:hypothetical protein EMIHUDRAFT_197462 [Emiliania huxleyi CCMP1516]|uniref:Secreted protein n=2 Tax=Emiliania huxleyi TaxID=2903 RepID=A0A0D3IUC9_EMIH1|nr:hypothetical protein EMIHUDRAFT_197462 [Emiliania huxleyi CCMP1516]EOD14864.1 hypothetical protein EMIHUDRAFT_197462 [Emiliania huxleyi CCMP1516]|eukprot:XP_005767293.1 hypothetical protein EMIHUDRAFT_197462 [Emiliania huxleyi CCMP1516]
MSRAAFCLATAELSLIGASGNLLSAWAIARLSAARSEVLMATALTLPSSRVGGRTWLSCGLSCAAVLSVARRHALSDASAASGDASLLASSPADSLAPAALLCSALLYSLGRVRCSHWVSTLGR